MRAISVFPSERAVRVTREPSPALSSPTEVRVRILEAGVCATDREICAFEAGTPPPGSDHLVIGHECIGEVIGVGMGVSRVAPGDLVIPMVRRPCPHAHCVACRAGRQDFCFTGEFRERGIKQAHGFMTEEIVEEERYLNVVPRALRDVGVLVEPLTVARRALSQLRDAPARQPGPCARGPGLRRRVLVAGAGPVGLLGAMLLRACDYETLVYGHEPEPNATATFAKRIGALYASSLEASPREIGQHFGAIDVVFGAAGASRVAPDAMPATGRDVFEAAVRDLGRFRALWPGAVEGLISGRHDVEAHRELLLGRPSGIKHVIRFAV